MELKEYQYQALTAFSRWLEVLNKARIRAQSFQQMISTVDDGELDLIPTFPELAWRSLRDAEQLPPTAGEHVARSDGLARPIPHVCFKVPTGGGKTLLGAAALERLNQGTGLVLWFVPSKAIYAQTKSALWNREHPYRQMLERASGGRVKMLEKDDRLTRDDVASYLCVMLISLQGANRKNNKDFLRMFRSSSKYPGFFPDDDDQAAISHMLAEHPDLERLNDENAEGIRHSLANVFKLMQPVVVLDEAHKAYGGRNKEEEFVKAISRFNPSLVLELSATPHPQISNLLVDIGGQTLKREQMIKLPINVRTTTNADWQQTLTLAVAELEQLEHDADNFAENAGRYIRPIAVVRVERTGSNQLDADYIHAEDARAHLQQLGVPANQIAIKSAEVDEITGVDLMSPFSPIRWIITKSALMEGWDCPFAYLLVILDNTNSKRAITQLMGRVMRQPHARRTDVPSLDQCYVYCTETSVSETMSHVKAGLEQEGLGDLSIDVLGQSTETRNVRFRRRAEVVNESIFLPKVLHREPDGWTELDYHLHIVSSIDWSLIQMGNVQSLLAANPSVRYGTVDFDDEGTMSAERGYSEVVVDTSPQLSWYARRLADLVPNPWQAARIACEALEELRASELSERQIYQKRTALVEYLRSDVQQQIDEQSEHLFHHKLRNGDLRFSLDTNLPRHKLADEPFEVPLPTNVHELQPSPGRQLKLSLFTPVIEEQFDSSLERRFAFYLDEQDALSWWHRVGVRQNNEYYLKGWKPERIWPDFIAMITEKEGRPHLLIFELKGSHLAGSEDTEYKAKVLKTLESAFNSELASSKDNNTDYGSVIVRDGPLRGTFQLVFEQQSFDAVERALEIT